MASEYDEREESVLEPTNPTLLDAIEEKNRAIGKKNLIHRMVCISRLRDNASDPNSVGNHYEKLFKHLQNMYQSEPITGLLLIYHKHIVHVVETSSDMLLKYVQDLQKTEQDETSFAAKSKILVVSHDIPDRLYSQWSFRGLDIQAHSLDQNESNEDTYNVVGDVLTQLVKLGVHLSRQPKLTLKSAMDSLYEKVPELLPQQGTIHSLLMNDDNCMILPKEYLAMYEQPFDFTLDSELSWPLPTRLFPYN
ncbi:testis-expressed protein 47-like [Liolophura sinensis]|uniref:testis-expressed protein 47-like n=1 Tax=Liolophura sinensis TaxID=3198878 RepID=UPI0031581F0E